MDRLPPNPPLQHSSSVSHSSNSSHSSHVSRVSHISHISHVSHSSHVSHVSHSSNASSSSSDGASSAASSSSSLPSLALPNSIEQAIEEVIEEVIEEAIEEAIDQRGVDEGDIELGFGPGRQEGGEGGVDDRFMEADLLGLAHWASEEEESNALPPSPRVEPSQEGNPLPTLDSIRLLVNQQGQVMVVVPPLPRTFWDALTEGLRAAQGDSAGEVEDQGPFGTLASAIQYWSDAASESSQSSGTGATVEIPIESDERAENLRLFLQRLTDTAEFRNEHARPLLAARVINMLQSMWLNGRFRESAFDYIDQSIEACDDRVILMLNRVELLLRIQEAEAAPDPKAALRELAIGLMKLQSVHQSAEMSCERQQVDRASVDEVEIYLAFETRLADHLQLPISTRHMIFEDLAGVFEAELQLAAFEANMAVEAPGAVEAYLAQWEPWNRFHRGEEVALHAGWASLPTAKFLPDYDAQCPFTQLACGELMQPVAISDRPTAMEFSLLLKWWEEHGTDPITQQAFKLDDLVRFESYVAQREASGLV